MEQWINDAGGLDRRFEKISKHLNEEQTLDLKKKWARFQRVASSERRLEAIMIDINEHFKTYIQGTGFKAMLATNSKYEAIKYHELFEEEGDIKTAFVISATDSREGHSEVDESDENKAYVAAAWQKMLKKYGDEEQYLDTIKDQFVHGEEIELIIVVDKLLTGFDAPRAQVLYVDKLLKEHNLLQAIARVNRLYEGKDFGFIIDYRGLLGDLDKALSDYSGLADFEEDDIVGAVFDIKDEIAKVKTFYTYLEELFAPVENRNDQENYEVFLADEEKRKLFYDYLSQYARALKLSLSSDKMDEIFDEKEVVNFKQKMKFYSELRKAIKIRYHEQVDFGKYEKQMQKLLDTFISAQEVNQLTKLVNIFDESFDAEIERVVGENARADAILSACTATINERKESNPAYYEKLSKRIKEIIDEYHDKRLTEEQKLKSAKDIRELLLSQKTDEDGEYPASIRNNTHTKAFYDNLEKYFEDKEMLVDTVLQVDAIFKDVTKKPDWKYNNDVKNLIDGKLDDIFWALEDNHGLKFEDIDVLLAIIRSIGINNY